MDKPWEKPVEKPWEKKETPTERYVEEKIGDTITKVKLSKTGEKSGMRSDERPPAQGLSKAVEESYDEVIAAMDGRLEGDIPLNDPYWTVKNNEVMKWNLSKDLLVQELQTKDPSLKLDNTLPLEGSSTTSHMVRQEENSRRESVEQPSLRK